MSKRIIKTLSAALALLMILAMLPIASIAEPIVYQINEAKAMKLMDDAWAELDQVEEEMIELGASPKEITMAVYKAALNSSLVDRGSIADLDDNGFSFKVNGMACGYDYKIRNTEYQSSLNQEVIDAITAKAVGGTKNGAGSPNVLLVAPYYGHDSNFTDQYKTEAQSIANATGGTYTLIQSTNASATNIVSNYMDKGVVIYDSHGSAYNNTSYLCLTTSAGITSSDYTNGWAYNGGSWWGIDGRYIKNYVSGSLSNCIVWMAICEGMKKSGGGVTGTGLLEAGAGVVFGYSQSVTFVGDYRYEATFWTEMKNGATVAQAFQAMKAAHGVPDPYGDAYPIVMSPVDAFPSNPDSEQTVYSDWMLVGGVEPEPITSATLSDVNVVIGATAQAQLTVQPSNADYSVSWTTGDSSVATVNSNGVATGVSIGSTTLTANIYDNVANTNIIRTSNIIVADAPRYAPTDTITVGDEYLIGIVVNGNVYLIMNYNPDPATSGNNYYYSSSSNYYGYTAQAVMSGGNIVGATGWTNDLAHCLWTFSSITGGTVKSAYNSSYNLAIYNSRTYTDLHPSMSTNYSSWVWDASQHTLTHTYSAGTKYASYMASVGSYSNFCYAPIAKTSSNSYIQLYKLSTEIVEPTYYTVTFEDWDGTVLSTQQVEEGGSATAPADPTRTGYTFAGWQGVYTNVTADTVVTATYTINSYPLTINYQYDDGSIAAETYSQNVNYGANYSVTSPVIAGYTPDVEVVSGTMGTQAVTVTVTYTQDAIPTNTLTIYYVYATGGAAAATYSAEYEVGANYSVASPVIAGYTPDAEVVSGTMGTANVNVTVTYTADAPVGDNEYIPVDSIVVGEEYLIGFIVNGNVYLLMNYNPSPIVSSNNYYYSNNSNYYGYTARAVMSGENITGVTGWTTNFEHCLWTFSSTTGGRIRSAYNNSYSLAIYNSTRYNDLHPSTSVNFTNWVWNPSAHTLTHAYNSYTKYASYMPSIGSYSNFAYAPTSETTSNSYVQLYKLSGSQPTYYTVTFVDWDGSVISAQQVIEGGEAVAPADPVREGYSFVGWDGDFTNVTSDTTVTATYISNTNPNIDTYAPVDTIVPGEEYLIGLVVNGNVYLIMNYNPNSILSSNRYYYSYSANYYGYTAKAVMNGDNIIGCTGWTDDLAHCKWEFSSTTGGMITSAYNSNYKLSIYNSARYTDLHPSTSNSFSSWVWDASEHTLTHAYSSYTKYASYMASAGSYRNFCYAPISKTANNSYVQLYQLITNP